MSRERNVERKKRREKKVSRKKAKKGMPRQKNVKGKRLKRRWQETAVIFEKVVGIEK